MESVLFFMIDRIIDLIFLVDIVINFRTVFINEKGIQITNLKMIAINYLSAVFWIDLMATLPIDSILEFIYEQDNALYQSFGLLKLGRVLRLNKIVRFMDVQGEVK